MANKIILRMLKAGISMVDLSEDTDVETDALWRIITSGDGQSTNKDNARAIARALSAHVSTLFVEHGDKFTPRTRG